MAKDNIKFITVVSILLGISLISDNWTFGLPLREFGTKPLLMFLSFFSLISIKKHKLKLSNLETTLILSFIFFSTLYSIYLNGSTSLKQIFLFVFVILFVFFQNKIFIDEKILVITFLLLHLIFFTFDFLIDINLLRSFLTFTINANPKPRGLFSEHSWSSMILGILPLIFVKKRFFFIFTLLAISYVIIFQIDSGTGLISILFSLCIFIFDLIKNKFLKVNSFYTLIILIISFLILFLFFSERFSIDYNESNATRLLVPFYLIKSGFNNFFFGVGINGQFDYLSKNSFSELSFLSEFMNAENGNTEVRFNSFNLFIRLWSSFGILSFILFYYILKVMFWALFQNKYILIILLCALVSTFSNDSFNNPYLILLITLYLQYLHLNKIQQFKQTIS